MVTIHCLECDAELTVSAMAEAGDLITCAACDAAFEVVAINPVEIDFADESESEGNTLELAIIGDEAGGADASDGALGDNWAVTWAADEAAIGDLNAEDDEEATPAGVLDIDNLTDELADDLNDLDDDGDEESEEDDWLGIWEDDEELDWDADDDEDDVDDVAWDDDWQDDPLA